MKLTRKEAFRLLEEFYSSKFLSYICTRLIEKIKPPNELINNAISFKKSKQCNLDHSDSETDDCLTEFTYSYPTISNVFYSKSPECLEWTNETFEILF